MSNGSKQSKPDCPLIGQDGNIFNLVGIASRALKRNGLSEEASEMTSAPMITPNFPNTKKTNLPEIGDRL